MRSLYNKQKAATTAGAYTANDVMGGLITFDLGSPAAGKSVLLTDVMVRLKTAVTPSLTIVLFDEVPSATNRADNDAYSLTAADLPKVIATLPMNNLGAYWTDHGTPKTLELSQAPKNIRLKTQYLYALIIDTMGVTLDSTSALEIDIRGELI